MMMRKFVLLVLLGTASLSLADPNRCGAIADKRSVYTSHFDSSNGHNILQVKIWTDTTSGYSWQDVVDDMDKWDENEPFVFCTVQIANGEKLPCEAERRGDWAMESPLPSLKVKFSNKLKYKGMDRILLNKHPWDTTRVRNKLTFELLQSVPNMASQFTQFAQLTVNDQNYGLYTLLEDIDNHFMDTHGLGKTSSLYKANNVDWTLAADEGVKLSTDPDYLKEDFESNWDIRGSKDHSTLIRAYELVSDANYASKAVMEDVFNIDNFASWLSVVFLSGNRDLVFNNFGVYIPVPSSSCKGPTPLYMMAWDNDGAWSDSYSTGQPGIDFPRYYAGVQYFWTQRTVQRFLRTNTNVDLLKERITYIRNNVFTQAKITGLTNAYKTTIRPLLEKEPDLSNIAWDASIEEWTSNIDKMYTYPALQFTNFAETINYPMPFNQYHVMLADKSSVFFYWDHTYVVYHKPYTYDFYLSTDLTFDETTTPYAFSATTTNNYVSVPADVLAPSTKYYYRVIARNSENPSVYFQYAYQTLDSDNKIGFGVSEFTTFPALIATPEYSVATITNTFNVTDELGTEHMFATLDNVDPKLTSGACPSSSFIVPEGWVIAPNTVQIRRSIAALNFPWGGTYLVLRDGSRINAQTGKLMDSFGPHAQHLFARATTAGGEQYAYFADCSEGGGRVLLAEPHSLDFDQGEDDGDLPTRPDQTGSASVMTSSVVLLSAVLAYLLL